MASKSYTDIGHMPTAFRELDALRNTELCDVIISGSNIEIPAHKVVLCACSEYFRSMFSGFFIESYMLKVELHQVNMLAINLLIEFIYSGSIKLNEDNVACLLETADYLQMDFPKERCREYLREIVSVENCIDIKRLADIYLFTQLQNESESFILENLDKVSRTRSFLELNVDELENLLENRNYEQNAEVLYEAVTDWVKYRLDGRRQYLDELLGLVATEDISTQFFQTNILAEEVLKDDRIYSNWLKSNFIVNSTFSSCENTIYIISREDSCECYAYDIPYRQCYRLSSRPGMAGITGVYYKNDIHVVGGKLKESFGNKRLEYSIFHDSWSVGSFRCPRKNASSCVLKDAMYIVGGFDGRAYLDTVLRYDFNTGFVIPEQPMNGRRNQAGLVPYRGSLYACGGSYLGNARSVERYDVREGKWYSVPGLNRVTGACSSAVVTNYLYCSRWIDGRTERLDFRKDKWEILEQDLNPRGSIAVVHGKLYRVHQDGISEYSIEYDRWDVIAEYNFEDPIGLTSD